MQPRQKEEDRRGRLGRRGGQTPTANLHQPTTTATTINIAALLAVQRDELGQRVAELWHRLVGHERLGFQLHHHG